MSDNDLDYHVMLSALEWVQFGSTVGWKKLRNQKGRLDAPNGFLKLWNDKLVHHNVDGELCLTDKGKTELKRLRGLIK